MYKTWWRSKDWNAVCDECGFKFKASQLKKRGPYGTGANLMVCVDCYELPHPQEMIRPIPDQTKLPWTRHEPVDTFVPAVCTPITRQGVAGLGTAGCAIAGLDLGYRGIIDITHNG